jgi:hypothetical protein
MASANFTVLTISIRHIRDRICAMSAAEAARLHQDLAAEAARICESAGVTDSIVRRFAADIVDEAVRLRRPAAKA